ncbi:hypothetical protein F4804DRAFT_329860 [Jackrogersella minutella]|nr:hypothetical protein F4804DRAFT_329860 [Jackrogersella minutella]
MIGPYRRRSSRPEISHPSCAHVVMRHASIGNIAKRSFNFVQGQRWKQTSYFPGNETYAPAPLVLLVSAIQNAAARPQPAVQRLPGRARRQSEGILDLSHLSATGAVWTVVWSLSSGNCSEADGQPLALSFYNRARVSVFTTKQGAQTPELVAVVARRGGENGTCDVTEGTSFPFNVAGTKYDGRGECAASSIRAAVTASACAAPNPVVSCPPSGAAGRGARGLVMAVFVYVVL